MKTELGQITNYHRQYSIDLLIAINRKKISIKHFGYDIWRSYELSWINNAGLPQTATVQIIYDCNSEYIIESKSLKLYLGSLNSIQFSSAQEIVSTINRDITYKVGKKVHVTLIDTHYRNQLPGKCIDTIIVTASTPKECAIKTTNKQTSDVILHSNLFRSICPVTAQPDWASIVVHYSGNIITEASLLQYLTSFRQHPAFHEDCISKIFFDIQHASQASKLMVAGYFTRRGGIDINPVRSTYKIEPPALITARQ